MTPIEDPEEQLIEHSNEAELEADAGDEELPRWLNNVLTSVETMPGLATRLPLWLPTLIAAWRAGSQGLALSATLRTQLNSEEPLVWPDKLAAEFITTVGEIVDELPSLSEALPMATEIVDLGGNFIDDSRARPLVLESVRHLEKIGEKLARALLEMAFFSPTPANPGSRARNLRTLFTRLEDVFDRTLQIWLVQTQSPRKKS